MQYIQEEALIPDEIISEAVPFNRAGQWLKRQYYGDERVDKDPGIIGKIGRFFRDPAKYEDDKLKFQGQQAANWLATKLGPVIERGRREGGVDPAEFLNTLKPLNATKTGIKFEKIIKDNPAALPTVTYFDKEKAAGNRVEPDVVVDLIKNLGAEVARWSKGMMGGSGNVESTYEETIRFIDHSNLSDYQKSLLFAAAFRGMFKGVV